VPKHPRKPKSTWNKRPYDLAVIAVAHLFPPLTVIWILLWTLVALAIWLEDRGPIFFRQKRSGKDGKVFTFLKFRTMVVDAEAKGLITESKDQRITRVGRLLRRTALDELPQLINILRGEMSFVGPRPLPVKMCEEEKLVEPRFDERLQVLPGLTGVAQIYLPRHCPARRRLRYDLAYIRKADLWLDVRLMLLAVRNTLLGNWGTGHRETEMADQIGIDGESKRPTV